MIMVNMKEKQVFWLKVNAMYEVSNKNEIAGRKIYNVMAG
jgi:hypothetical protein